MTFIIFPGMIFFYLLLMWKAGKTYPVLYLFFFTFFLQYIFSTHIIYSEFAQLRKEMPIGQDQLFEYAIPALLALFAGVFFFNKDLNVADLFKLVDSRRAVRLGYLLLLISYSLDFLRDAGVGWISSITSFTTYIKYAAVFCFLFQTSWRHYLVIVFVYLQLAVTVLRGGVFIDFLVWSTFLFFFVCLKFRIPFWLRLGFIFIAAPVLILIQNTKSDYRQETWKKNKEGGISLFSEIAGKKSERDEDLPFSKSEGVMRTVARLNQGWHLGLTLRQVPRKQAFANGAEMASDVVSAVIPRLVFPEKKSVHTNEKFRKYTGHKLPKNTSMTIGILGDFYVNFGRWSSLIALFIFGAVIARLLYFFQVRYVLPDPVNIIWVPFLLNFLIRADNDFYIMFNCILKGFVIFLFVRFLERRIWPQQQVRPLIQ